MTKKTVVVVSGGMDPVHSGHICLMQEAAQLGDILVVGLNSDEWLTRKKGHAFLPFTERKTIIENFQMVDHVMSFNDNDDSACDLLLKVQREYPDHIYVFANGGDRGKDNIREMDIPNYEFVFGVGGENKRNSSSWILEKWSRNRTVTRWGFFDVLNLENDQTKVKELIVKPGGCLSYQKHRHRAEYWFVKEGYGKYIQNYSKDIDHSVDKIVPLKKHNLYHIQPGEWHQLINDSRTDNLVIVEIQYGTECIEDDIISE